MEKTYRVIASALACFAITGVADAGPKPRTGGPVIYAASQGSTSGDSAIYRVSTTGVTVLVESIGQPQKMALDASGNLFIADIAGDNGDLIWRLRKGGPISPYFVFSGNAFASPSGIAVNSAGTIYTHESPQDRSYSTTVVAIDPELNKTALGTFSGGLYSLALTETGALLAAGSYFSVNRVYKVAAGGIETFIDGLPDMPRDAQIGPDEAIYIAIDSTNRIYRWDPNSAAPVLAVYADVPQPLSLAFDKAGYLYVGQNLGRISVVDPQGNVSLLATGFRNDPITGIAIDCPVPKGRKAPTQCFKATAPVTGP